MYASYDELQKKIAEYSAAKYMHLWSCDAHMIDAATKCIAKKAAIMKQGKGVEVYTAGRRREAQQLHSYQ